MKSIFSLLCLITMTICAQAAEFDLPEPNLSELLQNSDGSPATHHASVEQTNQLITGIRDGQLPRRNAQKLLMQQLQNIASEYRQKGAPDYPPSSWHFPVQGLSTAAITGGRQHGYLPRGYDFYSGNRHGGHPSLDIFIRDHNQDCLDDRTAQPVAVLSMTAGIVVALETGWDAGSKLRGGKYIWVYDPWNDLLVYYAHNKELKVQLGDTVKPGDRLATVGRSGFNAAKRRSPTHLHLTVLRVDGGNMTPVDVYAQLRQESK